MTSFRQSISVLAFAGIVLGLMRAAADDVYEVGAGSSRSEAAIKEALAAPTEIEDMRPGLIPLAPFSTVLSKWRSGLRL